MAVTRAANAIRLDANGDTIAHAVHCSKVVVDNTHATTTFQIRLRKGVVGGNIIVEAHVPVAVGTLYLEEINAPAAGIYLEIVAGTGSVTLLSE